MSGISGVTDQMMSNVAVNVAPLIAQPDTTVWRHVHMRYTDFVLAPVEVNVPALQWGSEAKVELDRPGELAFFTYLLLDIPGICVKNPDGVASQIADVGGDTRPAGQYIAEDVGEDLVEPYYISGVGHAACEEAKVHMGSIQFDELTSLWLHSWEQLSAPAGRRLAEMVGAHASEEYLVLMSREKRRLYVPLTFWFTQHPGLALPLASISFSKVSIQIKLRHYNELIKVGPSHPAVAANNALPAPQSMASLVESLVYRRPDNALGRQSVNATPAVGLPKMSVGDVQAKLEITYVFLTPRERSRFIRGSFQQLMLEHRYHQHVTKSSFNDVKLPFNLAINSIIFVVRREETIKQNELFNFAGPDSPVTGLPTDPVASLRITVSSNPRVDKREGRYFRLVVPYQHHTNIPTEYIYTYSFALSPEDPVQPSGTINGAKTDSIHFEVELTEAVVANSPVRINFMAQLWNIVRLRLGAAQKRFNS